MFEEGWLDEEIKKKKRRILVGLFILLLLGTIVSFPLAELFPPSPAAGSEAMVETLAHVATAARPTPVPATRATGVPTSKVRATTTSLPEVTPQPTATAAVARVTPAVTEETPGGAGGGTPDVSLTVTSTPVGTSPTLETATPLGPGQLPVAGADSIRGLRWLILGLVAILLGTLMLGKAATRGLPSFVWRAGQERRFQMVCHWAPLGGQRVLDVGCGVGMYTAAFLRETPHVFGVEIERERALEARARAAGVVQALGERIPFLDATFDVVFSHEVLEHVADDRDCVAEMVRVTRPGGRIVVFVPNRLYPFETHGIFWRGRYHFGNVPLVNWLPTSLRNRLAPHVRAYTAGDLRRLFDGLPVRIIYHTQVFPGYDNVVARAPALGRGLRAITYALERTPLRAFGLSHLLVVKKSIKA